MNKRLHIYYSGSVQGVGFRYMARTAAYPLGVTGWVKNLPDGRVEIICEGESATMDKFLNKIKDMFGMYIADSSMETENATGEFKEFSIRF
jgi:acylphosphatase